MNILRVKRSKSIAQASYDRMSGWYDWLAGRSEKPFRESGVHMLDIEPGEHVLEIGCGTGEALKIIAEKVGCTGLAVGCDISAGMLSLARRKVKEYHRACYASLIQVDGEYLALAKDQFDAVFMSFTLDLFDTPEIPGVLAECTRVLKPGGRIGVVALSRQPITRGVRLYEWLHEMIPQVIDCRPICLGESLVQAGFEIQHRMQRTMWGLPVELIVAENVKK